MIPIYRKGIVRKVAERDLPRFLSLGFEIMREEPAKEAVEEVVKEVVEEAVKEDLSEKTRNELRKMCVNKGIEYAERWGKSKLIEELEKA